MKFVKADRLPIITGKSAQFAPVRKGLTNDKSVLLPHLGESIEMQSLITSLVSPDCRKMRSLCIFLQAPGWRLLDTTLLIPMMLSDPEDGRWFQLYLSVPQSLLLLLFIFQAGQKNTWDPIFLRVADCWMWSIRLKLSDVPLQSTHWCPTCSFETEYEK